MSDKISHDIDVTDEREPQEVSERDEKATQLIEYRLNSMSLSEVASAATSWLAVTLADQTDEQIDELHKQLFHRELH
tara:strand:- start:292 stop:522 length:231 start_codon:yes stop_codon:yes gene_type:complete